MLPLACNKKQITECQGQKSSFSQIKETCKCCTYQLLEFLGSVRNRGCHSWLNIAHPCVVFQLLSLVLRLHELIEVFSNATLTKEKMQASDQIENVRNLHPSQLLGHPKSVQKTVTQKHSRKGQILSYCKCWNNLPTCNIGRYWSFHLTASAAS